MAFLLEGIPDFIVPDQLKSLPSRRSCKRLEENEAMTGLE